jgi:hypothetical protein
LVSSTLARYHQETSQGWCPKSSVKDQLARAPCRDVTQPM